MTETENLRYIINKVLNSKEMYGGEEELNEESENSTSSNSFSSLSDSSDKSDNDSEKIEKEKSSNYEKQYRQELKESSENQKSDSDSESEKANKFNDSDSESENKQQLKESSESDKSSESSGFSDSVSNDTTPEYQESEKVEKSRISINQNVTTEYNKQYEDEEINDNVLPKCLKSSRIQNIDKKNDFMKQISDKFPNLSNDGTSKSQVAILMRYILREVNKENPNIEDDEDKLFSLGQKYLKKMTEDDLDFDKFSEYDKNKKKARNLFIQMLYKIHKINPKLSYGKPNDNRVYDTVIVRSAAFKKAHEEYPDLPRLEFIQKVYDILTPDFVNSVDIEQEKQNYEEYMKNKGKPVDDSKKTKTKKTIKKKAKK